ncbi:ribonuclease E inhibitor RraB [Curtobacterium sp. Leaf261]|uniref:ribonuclease E inhibitor RraB n=1 Tax=Curtobacterium sp. Leaf261 TaxID=1736311 RepID=UPI0006F89CDD|nr:ribonuclease E inhibitor RraB [Curtobacterium sp. Leaf261]KQO63835.1 hypothetical protein ASF23_06465 [Curtobacterium sp. Leaf261]
MPKTTLAKHLALDADQLAQRRALGDRLDRPRFVDHVAAFRSLAAAEAAADDLRALGYTATVKKGLFRTSLEAARPERLDGTEPERFVTEVFGVVDRHGGAYDGWGAAVIPPGSD